MSMTWNREEKLNYLLRLNWTIKREKDSDEGYTILRVAELPSVIATGDDADPKSLEDDFWEALQATLEAALQFGDSVQVPAGTKLPWVSPATPLRNVQVKGGDVLAFVPQPKQTGSGARVNQLTQLVTA
jgi:hypothetical protein